MTSAAPNPDKDRKDFLRVVRRRQTFDLFLLAMRIAAAVIAALCVHAEEIRGFVSASAAFLILQIYRQRRDRTGFITSGHPQPREQTKPVRPKSTPKLSTSEVALITRAISDPAVVITRIKELVVPKTRVVDIHTDYWLRLKLRRDSGPVLFPILIPNKGQLLDGFTVTLTDGRELPTVTFQNSIGLVIACIDRLALRCGQTAYDAYDDGVREELIDAIGSRGPDTAGTHQFTLGKLRGALGDSTAAKLACIIAAELVEKYAVFVELPIEPLPADPDNGKERKRTVNLVVRARRRAAQVRVTQGVAARLQRRVGDLLGVRNFTFAHTIEQAQRAGSYHLEFQGPEGTYLAHQRLRTGPPNRRPFRYRRFRGRDGQRYAHLYIRGGGPGLRLARAQFTFYERPPGSIGPATIVAMASLIGSYATSRVALGTPDGDPRADAVALLVGLPAVASGWLGLDRSGVLQGGTLVAQLVTASTFVLSSVSIVLFFLKDNTIPGWTGIGHVLDYQEAWTVTLTASALIWAMAASSWFRRSALYNFVLRDPDWKQEKYAKKTGHTGQPGPESTVRKVNR